MEAKTKKYLLWGLGAVAVGTGGYFLFKYLQQKNDQQSADDFKEQVSEGTVSVSQSNPTPSPVPRPSKPAAVYNQFPLKYGSKGTLVRDIQIALNKKYGASIDVDGDLKGQTENALVAKDLPTVIDNQTYAKIITGTYGKGSKKTPPKDDKKTDDRKEQPSAKSVAKSISKQLHSAIKKDDVFSAVNALKKIKNKEGYKVVNDEFQKTKFPEWNTVTIVAPVSKTVVNALLDQFSSTEYKKKINAELYRIGLKYDGTKWSLSGLLAGTQQLITILPSVVWDAKGKRMNVPRSTIIGSFIRAKNGITEFETLDGRILYTNTVTIRYAA